jgi:hypothetical protein
MFNFFLIGITQGRQSYDDFFLCGIPRPTRTKASRCKNTTHFLSFVSTSEQSQTHDLSRVCTDPPTSPPKSPQTLALAIFLYLATALLVTCPRRVTETANLFSLIVGLAGPLDTMGNSPAK